jgi:hypothetical protein
MSVFSLLVNAEFVQEKKEMKKDASFYWTITSVRSSNQCRFARFPANNTCANCG